MEKNKDVMFFEMCRLCLDNRGYCDVFDKNEIIEDIYKCTGITVSLLDNLPQKICEKCLNIVNKAKELRIVATKNDAHLKSIFNNADIQSSEEATGNTGEELNTEKPEDTVQKHPVIESYLRVRNDLFESSVPEVSEVSSVPEVSEVSSVPEVPEVSSVPEVPEESVTSIVSPEPDSSQDSSPVMLKMDKNLDMYKCQKCSKVFNKWKKFYLHRRLHNKNLSCPKIACYKKFATAGDLAKHIRVHTGEKPFICDLCFRGFAQRITMKIHKETVHCNEVSTNIDRSAIS